LSGRPPANAGDATSPGATADDAFRLVSINRTSAPSGAAGNDWHIYRIAQGPNVMVGYRRGSMAGVTADVEQIVTGLNDRRIPRYGRPNQKAARPAATVEPVIGATKGGDADV